MYALRSSRQTARTVGPVLTTGALLVVCIGLAAALVWARGLGEPVRIDGWSVTFRPPRGWRGDPPVSDRYGSAITYREPTAAGTGRRVVFSRRPNRQNLGPARICRFLAGSHAGALAAWMPVEQVSFGPLPGARISLPGGACIHTGVVAHPDRAGEAYALELLSTEPLEPKDMQLCEALARAVHLAD